MKCDIKYFLQNANLKFTRSLCLFSFLTMWIVFFLRFYIFLTNNRENQQTKNKVQVFQKKQYNLKLYRTIHNTERQMSMRMMPVKYVFESIWINKVLVLFTNRMISTSINWIRFIFITLYVSFDTWNGIFKLVIHICVLSLSLVLSQIRNML